MRLAAIDIGSNATRLLINDVIELNGKPHFVKLGVKAVLIRLFASIGQLPLIAIIVIFAGALAAVALRHGAEVL